MEAKLIDTLKMNTNSNNNNNGNMRQSLKTTLSYNPKKPREGVSSSLNFNSISEMILTAKESSTAKKQPKSTINVAAYKKRCETP